LEELIKEEGYEADSETSDSYDSDIGEPTPLREEDLNLPRLEPFSPTYPHEMPAPYFAHITSFSNINTAISHHPSTPEYTPITPPESPTYAPEQILELHPPSPLFSIPSPRSTTKFPTEETYTYPDYYASQFPTYPTYYPASSTTYWAALPESYLEDLILRTVRRILYGGEMEEFISWYEAKDTERN
jgi:hypothetical protein